MVHSIVSPSQAHIWVNCTCYESRPSGEAANQGTAYHAMAEQALKEPDMIAEYPVQGYVDYVRSLGGLLSVEEAIPLDPLMPGYNLGHGHSDAYVIDTQRASLEVIDLKTGRIRVSPVENLQLAIYAYCICQTKKETPIGQIKLTIYQQGAAAWSITRDALDKFIDEKVRPGVHLVLSGAKVRKEGPYCKWCAGQTECKEYLKWLDSETSDPVELLQKAAKWEALAEEIKKKVRLGDLKDDRFLITERNKFSWKAGVKLPEDLYELKPVSPTFSLINKRPELKELVDNTVSLAVGVKS